MSKRNVLLMLVALCLVTAVYAQDWDQTPMPVVLQGIDVAIHSTIVEVMKGVPVTTKVKVALVEAEDFEESVQSFIAQLIEQSLMQLGYDFYDSDNMQTINGESSFQEGMEVNRGITDRELIAQGETTKVDKIIVAILDGGDGVPYTITVSLIDVRTGQKRSATR